MVVQKAAWWAGRMASQWVDWTVVRKVALWAGKMADLKVEL